MTYCNLAIKAQCGDVSNRLYLNILDVRVVIDKNVFQNSCLHKEMHMLKIFIFSYWRKDETQETGKIIFVAICLELPSQQRI